MGISDFLKKGITVKDGKTYAKASSSQQPTGKRLRAFNPATDAYREENAQRLELYHPKTMDDAKKLADFMATGEAVLVNLSYAVDESEAQSMLDFFCGAAYVLGGEATQVKENIFLLTVRGVEIMVED